MKCYACKHREILVIGQNPNYSIYHCARNFIMMPECVFQLSTEFEEIAAELHRAENLNPNWPDDLIHSAAIVSEESGELVQAVNNHVWKGDDIAKARIEAIHTGAMAIRFLKNLPQVKT